MAIKQASYLINWIGVSLHCGHFWLRSVSGLPKLITIVGRNVNWDCLCGLTGLDRPSQPECSHSDWHAIKHIVGQLATEFDPCKCSQLALRSKCLLANRKKHVKRKDWKQRAQNRNARDKRSISTALQRGCWRLTPARCWRAGDGRRQCARTPNKVVHTTHCCLGSQHESRLDPSLVALEQL